jgi:hypothetical protein
VHQKLRSTVEALVRGAVLDNFESTCILLSGTSEKIFNGLPKIAAAFLVDPHSPLIMQNQDTYLFVAVTNHSRASAFMIRGVPIQCPHETLLRFNISQQSPIKRKETYPFLNITLFTNH